MNMIEVKGLSKSFGELNVFENLDVEVKKGEVLVIIGPSGSGKSTFLRCLNNLEVPTGGVVTIEGEVLDSTNKKHMRAMIEISIIRNFMNPLPGNRLSGFIITY